MAALINPNFARELLHVVEGGVEETTELLQQKFDKIFFTGSTQVGRIVMRAAAEHLTPVTLELGGKNPVIVMPDCNLKRTAQRIAWGKLHNNGQACVSPDHLYVHESIKEKLSSEKKVMEGYPVRLDIRTKKDLEGIVHVLRVIGRLE